MPKTSVYKNFFPFSGFFPRWTCGVFCFLSFFSVLVVFFGFFCWGVFFFPFLMFFWGQFHRTLWSDGSWWNAHYSGEILVAAIRVSAFNFSGIPAIVMQFWASLWMWNWLLSILTKLDAAWWCCYMAFILLHRAEVPCCVVLYWHLVLNAEMQKNGGVCLNYGWIK